MPQNWLFLGTYKKVREQLLQHTTLNLIGALGPRAFETITGEVVNTVLVALTVAAPGDSAFMTHKTEKHRLCAEARAWIGKAARLPIGDNDGLLCLPAVANERPLAERLRAYLAAASLLDLTWPGT